MEAQEPKFAKIGREHVENQIAKLEKTSMGMCPTFYFYGTYDNDLRVADDLRVEYGLPRTAAENEALSARKTAYVAALAAAQAGLDHHNYCMRTDWVYWLQHKLGFKSYAWGD